MATTKPLTFSLPATAISQRAVYTNGAANGSTTPESEAGNSSTNGAPAPTKKRREPKNDDLIRAFVTEPADDDGNSKCAYAMFGDRFLYCEAFGWMAWTGTHWRQDDAEADIDRAIVAMLKARRIAAVQADKEVIVKATAGTAKRVRDTKSLFRSLVATGVDEFDQDPDLLNVRNGVLDLRNGGLAPHAPGQRFTYCIQVDYDPIADDTLWREFLTANVAGGQPVLDYLQMAVGYTITGHTSEECLWYVFGPSRSGKGTFTEVLLRLLGAPLSVEVDFATFTSKREGDTQNFDLAPLKPARLIVTSESNRYETLNAGKIKQLTGGNYVRAAYKHRDLFTYRPQFKPWLVSNQPVNADVDDDALWYRVKVIEFPVGHIGNEDKTLKPKMKAAENLRGVLRWAVDGAKQWYAAEDGLQHPTEIVTATKKQRDEIDFVGGWIEECTSQSDQEWWTSNNEAYENYQGWCRRTGIQPKMLRGFLRALKSKGIATDTQKKIDGRMHKGIKGLRVHAFDAIVEMRR